MARAEAFDAVLPTRPARSATTRRLVINADDFGRPAEINTAVLRAHTEGVLTSASLMVNEDGFQEAVSLARLHPGLGVGLHLALVCGRCALLPARIPGLVDSNGQFGNCPVSAGMRFFFRPSLKEQLRAEITAQFERFQSTGLPLDHVNGHLHFHLHPIVLPLVLEVAAQYGARAVRLTRDPLWLNARMANGKWLYRLVHAIVFALISRRAARQLRHARVRHTARVFGLLQDSRVDEQFVLRLLSGLPPGDSELYSHPSLTQFKHELHALLSPKVKRLIADGDIELIRYQDL